LLPRFPSPPPNQPLLLSPPVISNYSRHLSLLVFPLSIPDHSCFIPS